MFNVANFFFFLQILILEYVKKLRFTAPFLITLDTHQFNYAEGNASLVYLGLEVWGREICCELASEDPTEAKDLLLTTQLPLWASCEVK